MEFFLEQVSKTPGLILLWKSFWELFTKAVILSLNFCTILYKLFKLLRVANQRNIELYPRYWISLCKYQVIQDILTKALIVFSEEPIDGFSSSQKYFLSIGKRTSGLLTLLCIYYLSLILISVLPWDSLCYTEIGHKRQSCFLTGKKTHTNSL